MGRLPEKYKLIGREMKGNDTIYYGVLSEHNVVKKLNEEQMAFLVGRGQVVNVEAQLYKDKVLFRGIGIDIKSLPVVQLEQNLKQKQPIQNVKQPIQKINNSKVTYDIENINNKYKKNKQYINGDYDNRVEQLCKKYINLAYTMDETAQFKDVENPLHLGIVDKQNHRIYCRIDKNDGTGNDDFYISESTYELILYEYPEFISSISTSNYSINSAKHVYYHGLVIRMGLYSRIPEFKKLALLAKMYNQEVFNNKISNKLVVAIGNYKVGTDFYDLKSKAGYAGDNFILLNANAYGMSTIDNVKCSREFHTTLIHEMCHQYVAVIYDTWEKDDVIYDGNWEKNQENCGDKLYGISRQRYGIQVECHGKKFGEAVELAAAATGFSFDEIFSYGVKHDNHVINTKYTKDVTKSTYRRKDIKYRYDSLSENSIFFTKRDFDEVKNLFIEKEQGISQIIHKRTGYNIKISDDIDSIFIIALDNNENIITYELKANKYEMRLYRVVETGVFQVYKKELRTNSNLPNTIKEIAKVICVDLNRSI